MRATLSALAFVALAASAAEAQRTAPIELGVDGQISFGLDDQGTRISLVLPQVRAGFPISPAMTIEPVLGFDRYSDDGGSASSMRLDAGLLYHFGLDRSVRQFYVRPVIGINRVATRFDTGAGEVSDATTFMSVGVGGGVKVPLVDRLAARLEAEFRNQLEKDGNPSQSALNLNFGISYFLP